MALGLEWLQLVVEKLLIIEDLKVEKYYQHKLNLLYC
jgi:hypothetical protein